MGASYTFLEKKDVPPPPPVKPPDPPEDDGGDENNGQEDEWSSYAIVALFLGLLLAVIFAFFQM